MNHRYILLALAGVLVSGAVDVTRGQTLMPTLQVTLVKMGANSLPKLTFHNSSAAAATAWIIAGEPKAAASSRIFVISETVDTLQGHAILAIPPGQDGVASGEVVSDQDQAYRLIAVVFADGSIVGDQQWAQSILLSRQYRFQVLTTALSDLDAVKGLQVSDAVKYLDRSRQKQLQSIQQRRSATNADIGQAGVQGQVVFSESSAELKAHNVQLRAESHWESQVSVLYSSLSSGLQRGPQESLPAEVEAIKLRLQSELHALTESKPPLSLTAAPPEEKGR